VTDTVTGETVSAQGVEALDTLQRALAPFGRVASVPTETAIQDSVRSLKSALVQQYGASHPKLQATLEDYEQDPEAYQAPIRKILREAGADRDKAILAQAVRTLKVAEQVIPGSTRGLVDQINAHGVVVIGGDNKGTIILGDAIYNFLPSVDPRVRRDRDLMLRVVRDMWIDRFLVDALHGTSLQALGLQERPEAVPNPYVRVVQQPQHLGRTLAPGTGIVQMFDQAYGRLLVLGAPGSGKTTLLLELERELLGRAERDAQLPMPFIFPLAPWAVKRSELAEWLVDELNHYYHVPRPIAREWVDDSRILPLLDGLDEVPEEHRPRCAAAINAFGDKQAKSIVGVVVTSRVAEYDALPEQLQLRRAVVVQPLRPQQIDAYLASAGHELIGVSDALRADAMLQELASSPLLLSTMALAYQGVPAESLPTSGTIAERRRQMFVNYVDVMLSRRGVDTRYTKEQVLPWLKWLANALTSQSQSVLYVERLQPEWLTRGSARALYPFVDRLLWGVLLGGLEGAIVGLFVGPVGALLFGAVVGVAVALSGRTTEANRSAGRVAVAFLMGGLATGVVMSVLAAVGARLNAAALQNGLFLGAVVGAPIAGLAGGPWIGARRIHLVERISWSLSRALRSGVGSFAAVALLALILVLIALEQNQPPQFGFLVAIALGAPPALVTAILGGFETKDLDDETKRRMPNQGIQHGAHTALVAAGLSALASGLSIALTFSLFGQALRPEITTILRGPLAAMISGLPPYLQVTVVLCVTFAGLYGLIGGLAYGGYAYLSHFALRLALWTERSIPLNYVRFLNYASDRVLLRKVGGGYMFVHRLVQDYFCDDPAQ
jgi:hypothetical protein